MLKKLPAITHKKILLLNLFLGPNWKELIF